MIEPSVCFFVAKADIWNVQVAVYDQYPKSTQLYKFLLAREYVAKRHSL